MQPEKEKSALVWPCDMYEDICIKMSELLVEERD